MVRRLGSVGFRPNEVAGNDDGVPKLVCRGHVETPFALFLSDVGRTFWAAGSRMTGDIEAPGVSPKFGPNDSRSLPAWIDAVDALDFMLADIARSRR